MLFNSGAFFWFFASVYVLYRALPRRGQNGLLLAASYFFYGWWDVRFLALVGTATLVDFTAALGIERARQRAEPAAMRRFLWLSIATNLGMLAVFKYCGFFAESLSAALAALGASSDRLTLDIALPVGISFYTFQTLGYTLDVYRGRAQACRELPDFALFVAFFPQLLAGPVERARDLLPQLQSPRRIGAADLAEGGWLVFWGLFKKVFIADNLAPFARWGGSPQTTAAGADAYLVMIAFCFQFYCDFSGYSDMARGLARLLGIQLHSNFRLPYFARNPSDFWARWHITVGAWFRDHVYARLARRWPGRLGDDLAVLGTMALVGFWHGAQWRFVLWGASWGALIVAHRRGRRWLPPLAQRAPRALQVAVGAGCAILLFHVWGFMGTFFVAEDLAHAWFMQKRLLLGFGELSPTSFRDACTILFYVSPLLLVELAQLGAGRLDAVLDWPLPLRTALYAALSALLLIAGSAAREEFLYFAF